MQSGSVSGVELVLGRIPVKKEDDQKLHFNQLFSNEEVEVIASSIKFLLTQAKNNKPSFSKKELETIAFVYAFDAELGELIAQREEDHLLQKIQDLLGQPLKNIIKAVSLGVTAKTLQNNIKEFTGFVEYVDQFDPTRALRLVRPLLVEFYINNCLGIKPENIIIETHSPLFPLLKFLGTFLMKCHVALQEIMNEINQYNSEGSGEIVKEHPLNEIVSKPFNKEVMKLYIELYKIPQLCMIIFNTPTQRMLFDLLRELDNIAERRKNDDKLASFYKSNPQLNDLRTAMRGCFDPKDRFSFTPEKDDPFQVLLAFARGGKPRPLSRSNSFCVSQLGMYGGSDKREVGMAASKAPVPGPKSGTCCIL
jgi:hypothetical protein